MTFLPLWFYTGFIVIVLMILLWLYSLAIKNSSIVDIFWGTGFVIVYWIGIFLVPIEASRRILLLGAWSPFGG